MNHKIKFISIFVILILISSFTISSIPIDTVDLTRLSGNLVDGLSFVKDEPYPYLWVSNSGQGTVSKIDVINDQEIARYYVGSSPSRTAVDAQGDMIVGLRGNGIVKIAGSVDRCVDRNNDGIIQTSNSSAYVGTAANIFLDECVLWKNTAPAGTRGVVFDLEGNVWAGEYGGSNRWIKIDTNTGVTFQTIATGKHNYGSIIDSNGYIWSTSGIGGIVSRLNPLTGEFKSYTSTNGYAGYGIVFNEDYSKIYGGVSSHIYYYSLDENRDINGVNLINCGSGTGGYAAGRDIYGNMWFSCYTGACNGKTLKLNPDGTCGGTITIGISNHGIVGDGYGGVWSFEMGGSRVTKIDPIEMTVTKTLSGFSGLYTYSDASGYLLRTILEKDFGTAQFKITNPHGENANWGKITYNIENLIDGNINIQLSNGLEIYDGIILDFASKEIILDILIKNNSNETTPVIKNFNIESYEISPILISPTNPLSKEKVNLSFNIKTFESSNPISCSLEANGLQKSFSNTSSLNEFNFNLDTFDAGTYSGSINCLFNEFTTSSFYTFEVKSRGDIGIKALEVENNNPAVNEIIKTKITIENYSNTTFANIDIDLEIKDDLFNTKQVVTTKNVTIPTLQPYEIKTIELNFSYNKTDWIEINAIIDKEQKIVFDSRENKTTNKILYVGLPDPTLTTGGIELTTGISPSERPINGPGFNITGNASYLINNNLRLDTAGALIEIFVEGLNTGYFYTHTNNTGNFNSYIPNPNILGDYNAKIRVTDGTYESYSYEIFRVIEQVQCTENCYVPCTNCGGGTGTGTGGGNGGGYGGGSGGGYTGGQTYPSCVGPDLYGQIIFNPRPPFILEDNIEFSTSFYLNGTAHNYPDFNINIYKNEILVKEMRIRDYNGVLLKVYDRDDFATINNTFKMIIDPYNEIIECSKANNIIITKALVEPRFSDVSIDDIIISAQTLAQESNLFKVKVTNKGNVIANDVNVVFDNGEGVVLSQLIKTLDKKSTIYLNFNVQFETVGEKILTATTNYQDDDLTNNTFTKEFKVYSHDFFINSVDQGGKINLIFSNDKPSIGETIKVDATYKCTNPQIKGTIPITLFVNETQSETKEFVFDCSKDNIARFDFTPQNSEVYIMGIYINYTQRSYEQNLENNYATRALIINDPQSKITNNSNEPITFDYGIIIEKQNAQWDEYQNVITQTITLAPQETYFITELFNNEKTKIQDQGTYRIKLKVNDNQNFYSNEFTINAVKDCWSAGVSPHSICTLSDLDKVRDHLNWDFVLLNDIDASATREWNDGNGWKPIGECGPNSECYPYSSSVKPSYEYTFSGNFNGNNHVISDLTIDLNVNNNPLSASIGLFGVTSGNIYNTGLENLDFTISDSRHAHIGGLVGLQIDGLIENCYSEGNIMGSNRVGNIGGLVGSQYATIRNSHSGGSVVGDEYIGGLVGWMVKGTLFNSYSTTRVESHLGDVGGLVGIMYGGSNLRGYITNCFATGDVYLIVKDFDSYRFMGTVGGLVGRIQEHYVESIISNSYAVGNIFVPINQGGEGLILARTAGGLIGSGTGQIINSYSAGNIIAPGSEKIGGLIGELSTAGTITNSYWDTQNSGQSTSDGGVGKTTSEMKSQSTYVNWDFDTIWAINSNKNNGYPYLSLE